MQFNQNEIEHLTAAAESYSKRKQRAAEKAKRKQFVFFLSADLDKALAASAKINDMSQAELVKALIERHFKL